MEQPARKPLFDTADWVIALGSVPFQSPPIFVIAGLIILSRHWSWLAGGFFNLLSYVGVRQLTPFWCKVFPGLERYLGEEGGEAPSIITSSDGRGKGDQSVVASPLQPAPATPQEDCNGIAIDSNERNALLFAGRADALAAMVHAGKVGETEGIKIVYGVGPSSTNKTYLAARELLKVRLARMAPEKYRDLTPEQEALRTQLGLK